MELNIYYKLDENKNAVPCADIHEFAKMYEHSDRVVKQEHIDDVFISTVFLGIDHRFIDNSGPILFETMIFSGEHDQYQERYSTWAEAVRGHDEIVERLKNSTLT